MNEKAEMKNQRILVVEDHPLFRAMLVQLINQEPGMVACGEADDVSKALKLIEETVPDAVIMDLTLKGPNGLELIKDLKARNFNLPVLVISMHSETLYAERVLRAGAQGYIPKEATPAEVIAAIRKVLAGGMSVSENITEKILKRFSKVDNTKAASGINLLSDREIEVFQHVGRGLNSREISKRLHLETSTVDSYRARIKEKLGIKNAVELYQRAAQWLAEEAQQ
jgi:DNA-binding NarL/FixJ family response regulator